jgi:molybdopterin-guanine dinucleotide biosynthesis protein
VDKNLSCAATVSTIENPFAPEAVENLPFRFPVGADWETLLRRLESQQWCASIVGGSGTGKTTLLNQLAPHLSARGFEPVFFSLSADIGMREKERFPDKLRAVRAPGFILLDGAEQLSTRHWLSVRAAASAAAGFVVTVHRTSRLPVALELETSAKLLDALVVDLTGGKLPEGEAPAIFQRHRGNLRECLRELHGRWAG